MPPRELLAELQAKDIRLTVQGEQLRIDAPKGMMTETLRAAIRQQKPALLTLLSAPRRPEPAAPTVVADLCPLSVCPCCGTARFWQSIYGVRICARYHPPAHDALVAAWSGEGETLAGQKGGAA